MRLDGYLRAVAGRRPRGYLDEAVGDPPAPRARTASGSAPGSRLERITGAPFVSDRTSVIHGLIRAACCSVAVDLL